MGVGPDEASAGFGVATFRPLRAVSATEKLATVIDSIAFCTACHAERRRFEPRPSRHLDAGCGAEQNYLLFSGDLGGGVLVVWTFTAGAGSPSRTPRSPP